MQFYKKLYVCFYIFLVIFNLIVLAVSALSKYESNETQDTDIAITFVTHQAEMINTLFFFMK